MTKHYKHMSPRQLTYVTENLTYVIGKVYESNMVMNLHCPLIDMEGLQKTHMLLVVVHNVDEFR